MRRLRGWAVICPAGAASSSAAKRPSGQAEEEGRARGDERRAAMGDQLYVSVCQSENNICNILAPPLLTQEIRFRRVNLRII